jgi:hypothetical protein
MKKFLLIAVLLSAFIVSNAQDYTMTISAADDTLTAGVSGSATFTQAGYKEIIRFDFTVTKVSGTVAGTATLQGLGGDGVTWYTVPGTSAFTITDVATQGTAWAVSPSSFASYRIRFVNTTGVFIPKAYALVRNVTSKR